MNAFVSMTNLDFNVVRNEFMSVKVHAHLQDQFREISSSRLSLQQNFNIEHSRYGWSRKICWWPISGLYLIPSV